MGILDDAIREHLELKRKHGVSEDELERQEEEALGPARREAAQQHEDGEPEASEDAAFEADEHAPPAADEETVLFDMEHGEREPTSVEPPPVEPPPLEDELPEDDADYELEEDEGPGEDEELGEDEDELLSPEEESAAEAGDQDVLEDTPDFLQETPEHDRLWFEQKPPRDFDFD